MQQVTTTCPMCGAKIVVDDMPVAVERLLSGIDRTYIRCPECGSETTVCLTDPDIRGLMDQRRELQAQYAAAPSEAVHDTIIQLTERIKSDMDALNHIDRRTQVVKLPEGS